MRRTLAAGLLCAAAAASANAADRPANDYSPRVAEDVPTRLLWGDTHVHTSYSSGDAYLIGLNQADPEVAYRFARGEVVTDRNGNRVRINRPLDFLVIADHAEGLGLAYELQAGNRRLARSGPGKAMMSAWRKFEADPASRAAVNEFRAASRQPLDSKITSSIWARVVDNAERFNEPGRFTAFAGYEWTSGGATPGRRGNLHRVVIFADGPDRTAGILPFSAADSPNPEDLWKFLRAYIRDTGGGAMAIPHNPNLSNGEMFDLATFAGEPLTREWAELRASIEPLAEITQQKGDSEAHPLLSPTDEFANFENWNGWAGFAEDAYDHPSRCCADRKGLPTAALAERKRGEYLRAALKRGLALEAQLGINPYRFGVIGSTDTHTSFASGDNDNFWAQYPNTPPSATRAVDRFVESWPRPLHWETAAGGFAAVWAHENTRSSVFAALLRREVYATTGPRIVVRAFAGWDFAPDDAFAADVGRIGYRGGVPMGGTLTADPRGREPKLLIAAMRDPQGANLDRVQVIKGWRNADGSLAERVYDVALSDGRTPDESGAVPAVGSTVDVASASYRNTIGAPELNVVWRDPHFDARLAAFYYVRVLEIPTPRWPAYDARHFGVTQPPEVLQVTQERAYTSPIFYAPR